MSRTVFISDLHLDSSRPAVTRALGQFLSQHSDCARLFILGDLFEAWPGDDDDSPIATEVSALLRDFSNTGPKLSIMPGNRDFLLGERFCRDIGATLLDDPTVIDLYGKPTLLMHGDSLCTDDTEYQKIRRTSRDPAWQARLLRQPLAERRKLADRLRARSMEANSDKSAEIMDVNDAAVDRQMSMHGVDQLIHGHTHRPDRHNGRMGTRWVLGAWEDMGWSIEASSDGIDLTHFYIFQ